MKGVLAKGALQIDFDWLIDWLIESWLICSGFRFTWHPSLYCKIYKQHYLMIVMTSYTKV